MTRDEAFEFLDRTARGIAEMFGSSCETLVHDMGVPTHPILSIYNGHVSGREVGSTMDIMGIGLELDEQAATTDQVNLAAVTPDGRQTMPLMMYTPLAILRFIVPAYASTLLTQVPLML